LIVVDTSALCAVLFGEVDADQFDFSLFHSADCLIGAPTLFEFLMVAEGRRNNAIRRQAERLIAMAGLRVVAWSEDHALIARQAFALYGKGQGHPAQLNYGDCMSYALAKALEVPLLFKGEDFRRTDIRPAV
jgi:ribonuclease VapC